MKVKYNDFKSMISNWEWERGRERWRPAQSPEGCFASWASTPNLNRRFHDDTSESPLGDGERIRRDRVKRGNEREDSGETIYPKFASSRLATGYTLICPLGNLSTPNAQPLLLVSSWFSTSFPATPSIPTNPILLYFPPLLAKRETAKPHGNFKHRWFVGVL